jgi:hypothetical protein
LQTTNIIEDSIIYDFSKIPRNQNTDFNYVISTLLNKLNILDKKLNASFSLLYLFEKDINSLADVEKCFIITELTNFLLKNNVILDEIFQENIPFVNLEILFRNYLCDDLNFLGSLCIKNNLIMDLKENSLFFLRKGASNCTLIELLFDYSTLKTMLEKNKINTFYNKNNIFYNCLF